MHYAAVIFDLDGTLLDTLDDLADSMNAPLVGEGYAPHPRNAYRHFVGDGMEALARRALGVGEGHDGLVQHCMAAMEAEYALRWNRRTRPYPGVQEMLDGLERKGVAKAVFSNKPEPFVRLAVSHLLGAWMFDSVRGARPHFPRKPDPRGALEIAREWELPPARILYLGDTNTDIATARAAGMCAVGAAWGFRGAAELFQAGADHVIARPVDLLTHLGG